MKSCGCHHLWEEYTRTTIEGKACLIVCKRFESFINEQCWSEEDVNGSCLTENDKLLPFPETAKRALYTKLVAARSRKQSALQEVSRARRALEERHRACRSGTVRCLDNVFAATRSIAEAQYSTRLAETNDEINVLI